MSAIAYADVQWRFSATPSARFIEVAVGCCRLFIDRVHRASFARAGVPFLAEPFARFTLSRAVHELFRSARLPCGSKYRFGYVAGIPLPFCCATNTQGREGSYEVASRAFLSQSVALETAGGVCIPFHFAPSQLRASSMLFPFFFGSVYR